MTVYTWDFMNFRASFHKGAKVSFNKAVEEAPLPDWTRGLMLRETRSMTPEEVRQHFGFMGPKQGVVHTDQMTPAGEAWVQAVHADLERRFPHEHGSPDGFRYFVSPKHGGLVIYDPGLDMYQEWANIFGRTTPLFTDCRRLPDSYRPWLSSGTMTPTVFFDGQREDFHQTDSVGAPYFEGRFVQTQIDWLYAFPLGEDAAELRAKVLSALGEYAVGWKCRVQP